MGRPGVTLCRGTLQLCPALPPVMLESCGTTRSAEAHESWKFSLGTAVLPGCTWLSPIPPFSFLEMWLPWGWCHSRCSQHARALQVWLRDTRSVARPLPVPPWGGHHPAGELPLLQRGQPSMMAPALSSRSGGLGRGRRSPHFPPFFLSHAHP